MIREMFRYSYKIPKCSVWWNLLQIACLPWHILHMWLETVEVVLRKILEWTGTIPTSIVI
jgi:hypothetical protein